MSAQTEAKISSRELKVKMALLNKIEIEEELLIRQIRDGDIYGWNYYCFKNREGVPWETKDFQLECWEQIELSQKEGYSGIVLRLPIEHGKTEQMIHSYSLKKIGDNPNIQIAIIGNTSDQAEKDLAPIKQDIQVNDNLHRIYPKLRPERRLGRNQVWATNKIIVEREINSKDYTVQAVGIGGNLLGTRLDRALFDDPSDMENTSTPHQREKVMKWIASTILGRLVAGGFGICIMTSWVDSSGDGDCGDVGYELVKKHNFKEVVYRALKFEDEKQVINCEEDIDRGIPLWPEQFPLERIKHMRKTLGAVEFDRQMMNRAKSDATRYFKSIWFESCLEKGLNYSLVSTYQEEDLQIITGIDLATKLSMANRGGKQPDLTVFFTIGIDKYFNRRILNIIARRMEFPEIIRTFKLLNEAYKNNIFIVESNAAQVYVKQELIATTNIRVKSYYTTGKTKHDPILGIKGMGIDFENGKWIMPKHPEVFAFIQECQNWSPDEHTGDRLMGAFLADSYLDKQATPSVSVESLDKPNQEIDSERRWNIIN